MMELSSVERSAHRRGQQIGNDQPVQLELFLGYLHIDSHINVCKNWIYEREKMATNLALDDRLIEEARIIGEHKSKKEAVTAALQEYIQRRKQLRVLDLFGTIDYDPNYDYKAERKAKRG